MKLSNIFPLLLVLITFSASTHGQDHELKITGLKTEYADSPLGIDVSSPRFSWRMESSIPGAAQKSFQLLIINEQKEVVWNSGRVYESASVNVKYQGRALKPRTKYDWTVHVWDQNGIKHSSKSWFETGLMNPDDHLTAWSGAKWIGGNDTDLGLYPQYLPVFKLNYSIQLDSISKSTRAGFIYGANDPRLLDKNKNYYNLNNVKDSTYILLELDTKPLSEKGEALLNIYRVGYHPNDKRTSPLKTLPIPGRLLNNQNKYHKHTIYLSSVMGATQFFIDSDTKEGALGSVGINPLGQGGDYIAFPVLGQIGFSVAQGQAATYSNVAVRNERSPGSLLFSKYEVPLLISGKKKAQLKLIDPAHNSMPMLRTVFSSQPAQIKKARLYVTSRGIYDVYLNGSRINADYFNPGLTQYNKSHLYQTFDVTPMIRRGKNALGAVLGEGWWSGGSTYTGDNWNFFGDRQSLLAMLVITHLNGKEEKIVTDPTKWSYFNNGPVVYSSLFQGEVYDARKEAAITGWSTPEYNESKWHHSTEVGLANHVFPDFNTQEMKLMGQFGETVKKVKELQAVSMSEVRPGVFLYDLGQNIAGVPNISLKGMIAGKTVAVRFGEVLYPNLPEYERNVGMLMLENIRAAMAMETYITRGGEEAIKPRFTYHGFRYIEITGITKPLPLSAVKADVLSSVHKFSASYETSNSKVNKLWENITWSTLANFMSIPTDCPQRNERLGWSGDISVFSRTAAYLASLPQFLRRHMLAMRDVQAKDGRFSDVAPLGGGFGDTLWGSAGIAVAWESYQQYGDKEILSEHYDAMKKYIQFLESRINHETGVLDDKNRANWSSLGDWLSPEYDKTEKSLLWEAYFINNLHHMGKIAAALEKKDDERKFLELGVLRANFFNKTYIDPKTGKTAFRNKIIDSQSSYAVPLAFGIIDDSKKRLALDHFAASVKRANPNDQGKMLPAYSLMTGFIGTAWISTALSDNGYTDLAYRQLQATTYPSWLYPVEQGATTIWERLNSYTHTEGFGGNNNMNSFNHYSFGAVGGWMCSSSLGIQRDENSPGFKHFLLVPKPDPTNEMTYAKGSYESLYGKIESSWRKDAKTVFYHFLVPPNTSATVYLSGDPKNSTVESFKPSVSGEGATYAGYKNEQYIFELLPGKYEFKVRED